jgi:hypothetical protein
MDLDRLLDFSNTVKKIVLNILVISIDVLLLVVKTVTIVLKIWSIMLLMRDAGKIVLIKDYLLIEASKLLISGTIGLT